MSQPAQSVSVEDFRELAAHSLAVWSELVGAEVSHPTRGLGRITSVEPRPNCSLIRVAFERETVAFTSDSFPGVVILLISTSLASRMAAELAEIRERDRLKANTLEEFGPLATKWGVPHAWLWQDDTISPLCAILDKAEEGTPLEKSEIRWLEDHSLYPLLSTFYFDFYTRNGDPWYWVLACKSLRQARLPKEAVALSEGISAANIQDKNALSALWTTRGGALRDVGDLEAAKASAMNAMRERPDNHHPHTLMGAILYQEGDPVEGDKHFAEATRLGAPPSEQDSSIRHSLRSSEAEARRAVLEHLYEKYEKDPVKYAWVLEFEEPACWGNRT